MPGELTMAERCSVAATSSSLDAAQRRRRVVVALGLVSIYVVSRCLKAELLAEFVMCPFRRATGWPCLLCGFTRGFIAISHGDVATAWRLNVLCPPVYLLGLVAMATTLAESISGQRLIEWRIPAPRWLIGLALILGTIRYLGLTIV